MNSFTGVFQGLLSLFNNLLPVIKCIKKVPVIACNKNHSAKQVVSGTHVQEFFFSFADDTFEGL